MPYGTSASTGNYALPLKRQFGFAISVEIDMGNLPTLPERMHQRLTDALTFHLKDAAEAIIAHAQRSLAPLPHPKGGPPVGPHKDEPGGLDTGRLRDSLIYDLVEGLLETGVFYDLLSHEAEYWQWVEFGHWVTNAKQPWFWEGYHYLENAVMANQTKIMRAVRAAWSDTAIALAAEARVPTPGMYPGGTSPLLHR